MSSIPKLFRPTEQMAGPVGFEPTILGYLRPQACSSEGPRLGPGSTTGPAAIANSLALLLPWAIWTNYGDGRDAISHQELILYLRTGGGIEAEYLQLERKTSS